MSGVQQTRPWVRYWARMFDIYLFSGVAGILLAILAPRAVPGGGLATIGIGIIALFLWIVVESLLLSWFGTTPGKSLLRTHLRLANNPSIPYSMALSRCFRVWWRGMGAGIPVISLFTLLGAYDRLSKGSVASWDSDGGFVVSHEKIGALRVVVAAICFVVFVILSILGTFALMAR